MDRRTFMFTSTGASVGSFLVRGTVDEHDAAEQPRPASGLLTGELAGVFLGALLGVMLASLVTGTL